MANPQNDEWVDAPAGGANDEWEDAPAAATTQPTQMAGGMVQYDPSKNDFKNKGILKTVWDELTKSPDPSARAALKTISYPGGLVSDAGIAALKRAASMGREGLDNEEWQKALAGEATPASEQLKKAGYGPLISYGLGVPYSIATDPMASAIPSEIPSLTARAGPALANSAEKAAIRHLRPTPKVAQALGPERLSDVGREALDSGAIGFGRKAQTTAERLGNLKDESGSVIGDVVNASPNTVDPKEVAARFDAEVIDPLRKTSKSKSVVDSLEAQRDAFLEHYGDTPMSAAQVEEEKRAWQNSINYLTDPKLKQQADRGMANVLKNQGENMVTDEAFKPAKRAYANQSAAENMAKRTAGLTDSGNGLMGHMTDLGVGLEGLNMLAHGNPVSAGLLALLRGGTKGRVTSSTAKTLDALSKAAKTQLAPAAVDTAVRQGVWNKMLQSQPQSGGNP